MSRMSLDDFEARYRDAGDPWGYESSPYEQAKYAATLAACGPGPFAHALELAGSIGVFTELLAPRAERVTTVDASPTAVATARRRLAGLPHVEALLGTLPAAVPAGPFDLLVASEILYYLDGAELDATLARLRAASRPGARLVAVHWRPPGAERPLTADDVHGALRALPWLAPRSSADTADYRLDVLEVREVRS